MTWNERKFVNDVLAQNVNDVLAQNVNDVMLDTPIRPYAISHPNTSTSTDAAAEPGVSPADSHCSTAGA